jgi:hypothetical protein
MIAHDPIGHAVLDYLRSLGLRCDAWDGEARCRLERGWQLDFRAVDDSLRVVVGIPCPWDLPVFGERALVRVNLLRHARFAPLAATHEDRLLLSLALPARRCVSTELAQAVDFLVKLGEDCQT